MKLHKIAQHLGCSLASQDGERDIAAIRSLEDAGPDCIAFVMSDKLAEAARKSEAVALIVPRGVDVAGKVTLEVDDPYVGYARVAQLFEDRSPSFGRGVHASAVVDPSADIHPEVHIGPASVIGAGCRIGEGTVIDAGCVIENDCVVGAGCRIHSGVVIRHGVRIADRVIIQSGAVIGSEGFGNAREGERWVRIPCFGTVIIEEEVEIGAGVTIDRGNFGATLIGRGARLDNLIHIAHNVTVGDNCAMAAQVGISGSTRVGKGVLIGGQAGFVGHISIGDGAFVGAKAGVSKGIEPGAKVTGYPARDLMKMRRIEAAQLSLPDMVKKLKRLRREVDTIREGRSKGD
jgi:UDP-3-O-[3-hydroxymyristoyl] glucosamine N-acyltransferase